MDSASHSASHGALDSEKGPLRLALTEARLKLLEPPASGELRVYDTKQPGLLLRWRAGGKARWYISKRVRDRMVNSSLGELSSWPDVSVESARSAAVSALNDLGRGESPADTRKKVRAVRAAEAGKVLRTSDVLKRHLQSMADKARTVEHIADFTNVVGGAIAAGIVDLLDPKAAAKAADWLDGRDLSPATKKRNRGHLRALGRTATRWWPSMMTRNPFEPLEAGPPPLEEPPVFSPVECMKLVTDKALSHPWGHIGALLLYGGLRLSEGLWMHWERVDINGGFMSVTPPRPEERANGYKVKRNKPRTVPIHPELANVLRALRKAEPKAGYLFDEALRHKHRAEHRRYFHAWVKAQGFDYGERHPHSLRHSRAYLGLAAGENDLTLQLALGHSGAAMTSWYAQQAMRYKMKLKGWGGVLKLRDPAEVKRLTGKGTDDQEAAS